MWSKISVPASLAFLFLFLVFSGWGEHALLEKGMNDLLKPAEIMEKRVQADDWQEAGAAFAHIESIWRDLRRFWPMLIHHHEMDRIEESISKLKSYLKNRDKKDSLAELYSLIHYIRHIPEKEAFSLQNIL